MGEQHTGETNQGAKNGTGKARPRKKLNKFAVAALIVAGILVLLVCVYYLLCYTLVLHLQVS